MPRKPNLITRPYSLHNGCLEYRNEAGESFRVATESPVGHSHGINIERKAKGVVSRFATGYVTEYQKEGYLELSNVGLQERGFSMPKGRMAFRMFLNEAISIARKNGLHEIRLFAMNEKLVEYFFLFGFERTGDPRPEFKNQMFLKF